MLASWVASHPDIPQSDIRLGSKNSLTLVALKDGVPILFVPLVLALQIAHLGFAPESPKEDRLEAMEAMLEEISGIALARQIGLVQTLSSEHYGVARWAVDHGFEADQRTLFTLSTGGVPSVALETKL